MEKSYEEFLEQKRIVHKSTGFEVSKDEISPIAKPHQNATIRYVLRKGASAIFHDTGLGKTLDQLEIGRLVIGRTNKPFLIVMPLWVAYQTIDEAKKLLNMDLIYASSEDDVLAAGPDPQIFVTNYERLHNFENVDWGGISFDESSIFKGDGKYFERAKKIAKNLDFVVCCSATPSPNSVEEMGRQAEVLGIMTVAQMKATFFVNRQDKKKVDLSKSITIFQKTCSECNGALNDIGHVLVCDHCGATYPKTAKSFVEISKEVSQTKSKKNTRQGWELRPHAKEKFYEWLASWAMAVKMPSDLGFSDEGYILPKLTITPIFVDANYTPEDQLVFTGLGGVGDRSQVRKLTIEPKCQMALEIIGDSTDQWVVWCGLNPEADRMKKLLGDRAVNVQGSDKLETKIEGLRSFATGETQILVTKTKICGHGSNFQNCHKVIFVGLSDSWESFYQAIKRFHRFKQESDVEVYVIMAEEEREIWDNVQAKGREAELMTKKLIENAELYQKAELDMKASSKAVYVEDEVKTDQYHIMLGDSTERLKEIESSSIGLSVYSPPFEDLFVYSNSERDLGNSATKEDFYEHYGYIVDEIMRVTMPGRKTVVHVADIHARKDKDGFLGLKDFSGDVIKLYINHGWLYQGRIPIAKNPQATAIRLKAHELMFATMKRDASRLMPVQPDYFLIFTKPGKNPEPILPIENSEMNENTWIDWAGNTWLNGMFERLEAAPNRQELEQAAKEITRDIVKHYLQGQPIWNDIKETEVLGFKGKSGSKLNEDDTKHICPLQLEPVERVIKMWSNPGDKVLTPFMGIGTEVYQAIKFNRFGIGIELKPEYYQKALENIEEAVRLTHEEDLFSYTGIKV